MFSTLAIAEMDFLPTLADMRYSKFEFPIQEIAHMQMQYYFNAEKFSDIC